jgi:branched-chain amino acid transport system substrate-binding protein
VLARWLGLTALLAAVAGVAGCGGTVAASTNQAIGSQLAVYSSLPLQGPLAAISQELVNGEKLALSEATGRVGRFKIGFASLDDSNPTSGRWSPGETATAAKTAAQDTSTIAYLGDYNSGATAVSLFPINEAGIPQVSPGSPYQGLTSPLDAGQDEPARFYPTGKRTFVRLIPGDAVQAAAQVVLMRSLGIHTLYVLDNQDPFQAPLAKLVAADALAAGITIAGHDSISVTGGSSYSGETEKIAESGAQGVFFAGEGTEGAIALWQQLHAALPHLQLLGPSALAEEEGFTAGIGAAGASTYLTTPALPPGAYPASAQRVLRDYRRAFGGEPTAYALFGYETMSVVLGAIRRAGAHGNDRTAVVANLFSTRNRDSVLGRYSIEPNGETTLSRYAIDRVVQGRAVFLRALNIPR